MVQPSYNINEPQQLITWQDMHNSLISGIHMQVVTSIYQTGDSKEVIQACNRNLAASLVQTGHGLHTSLNHDNTLIHFKTQPIPTDKCSYHQSSNNLLFITNRYHHRQTQLDIMHLSTYRVDPSHYQYMFITTLHLQIRETLKRGGWEDCKNQNTRKTAIKSLFYN